MDPSDWSFRVYLVGGSPTSLRALENLRALVEDALGGEARIEVVDLGENPRVAVDERILAVPTVARVRPEPEIRIIGDLSDPEAAGRELGLPRRGRTD